MVIFALAGICLPAITFGQNEENAYNEVGKRDPFLPLIDAKGIFRKDFTEPSGEKAAPKVILMGISNVKGKFYALIDGELVQEGQIFKGMNIERITPEKVVVLYAGKLFEFDWQPGKDNKKADRNE